MLYPKDEGGEVRKSRPLNLTALERRSIDILIEDEQIGK